MASRGLEAYASYEPVDEARLDTIDQIEDQVEDAGCLVSEWSSFDPESPREVRCEAHVLLRSRLKYGSALLSLGCIAVICYMVEPGQNPAVIGAAQQKYADICVPFNGILFPNSDIGSNVEHSVVCCAASCGDKCGTEDCHLGIGGSKACCKHTMEKKYCSSMTDAPCYFKITSTTTTTTTTTETTTTSTQTSSYKVFEGDIKLLTDPGHAMMMVGSVDTKGAMQKALTAVIPGSFVQISSVALACITSPCNDLKVSYVAVVKQPTTVRALQLPSFTDYALINVNRQLKKLEMGLHVTEVQLAVPKERISSDPTPKEW